MTRIWKYSRCLLEVVALDDCRRSDISVTPIAVSCDVPML